MTKPYCNTNQVISSKLSTAYRVLQAVYCKLPTANGKKLITAYCILLFCQLSTAQNIDVESPFGIGKGQPLKISGGISANSVFYNSDQDVGREAFTYFLQGNLNISFYQISMPISYSFTNQGSQLGYDLPFKFNRLALHPKYKWIQAHIGDVAMSFSPYTLNNFQFTGGGVDLTPKGNVKVSAMAGRLLRATEDDGDVRTTPAFSRFGYGLKVGYTQEKYTLGVIGFYAKDDINSIAAIPDDRGITPKENLVISLEGRYKVLDNLELKAEYASTAITQDLRASDIGTNGEGLAGLLFDNRGSTEYYTALKAGFDYSFGKSSVGVAYERIDPGYETLGAYFFNNDFENITLNTSTSVFKDKVNLSVNVGYQRDDLENQKEQTTNRTVGAINATYNASEKLTITAMYSNFNTFTNARVNQFDDINDDNLLDDAEEQFDYRQLSQNANINVNYVFAKSETTQQNLNVNYALADVVNEQGGIVRIGDASTFHNVNAAYTLGFPKLSLNITSGINVTLNTIGREDASTWGPTLSLNKKFLENKLNTGFGASYNTSNNQSGTSSVTNFRANASYVYKEKHNFNLNAIQLFRSVPSGNNQELTVTFGYNYTFDIGNFKRKKTSKDKKVKEKKERQFSFSYKTHNFSGTHQSITEAVTDIRNTKVFRNIVSIERIAKELARFNDTLIIRENTTNKAYKKAALDYLKYLYKHKDYLDTYYNLVFNGLKDLYREASFIYSANLENEYFQLLGKINKAKSTGETIEESELELLKNKERKFRAHTWMQNELQNTTYTDVTENKGVLKIFKEKYASILFSKLEEKENMTDIILYLKLELADFYHNIALKTQD